MSEDLLQLPEILLLGPGPSMVPEPVYSALRCPTIGHLDPRFIKIMDQIKSQLQTVMRTDNEMTLPISGTGSAGMETCFVNLVEPGDRVLVLVNGVFGKRMVEVATRLHAEVEAIEWPWGAAVSLDMVADRLSEREYDLVAVVHAETSTGVANPVAEISRLVRDTGALLLVDAVTSLGGMPVGMDSWNCDALYSGTQKCLSCPPGLAPVSFGPRAVEKIQRRKTKVSSWYMDTNLLTGYWQGSQRSYHHTAPVNMLYALHAALRLTIDEGLDRVFQRHVAVHRQLVEGLAELGFDMFVDAVSRLPMLNAVKIPEGLDEASVRSHLLYRHGIEIGAGLGPLAGKVWRIGLMGFSAQPENVVRFLDALKMTMARV